MMIVAIKQHKSGLFLSVELMVVLIILAGIAGTVAVASTHLIRSYKVYQISREYSRYSEAISNFRSTFGSYPGDIASNKLAGTMYDANLVSNYNQIITISQPVAYADLFITANTNHIDGRKAQLAFMEMFKAGLVDQKITNTALSNSCGGYNNIAGTLLPIATFTKEAVWTIGMDSSNSSSNDNNSPKGSDLYNASLYPRFMSKIRLILFRYQSTTTCDVDIQSDLTGGVAGIIASMLDEKIDDGLPTSYDGILHADQGSNGKCKYFPEATKTTIFDTQYVNSNDSSSSGGCILTFLVKG